MSAIEKLEKKSTEKFRDNRGKVHKYEKFVGKKMRMIRSETEGIKKIKEHKRIIGKKTHKNGIVSIYIDSYNSIIKYTDGSSNVSDQKLRDSVTTQQFAITIALN